MPSKKAAIGAGVGHLALGAFAEVLHLGQRAQRAVLHVAGFGPRGIEQRCGSVGGFLVLRHVGGRIGADRVLVEIVGRHSVVPVLRVGHGNSPVVE